MARIEKTVFISYRRTDISWALAVYQYLTNQGYDVFFDYTHIPSGDFEQIIIGNIKARAHFVLILTPTTLDRTSNEGDWVRREIETAINEKRNVIPLFFDGFSFGSPNVKEKLTGKMANIRRYNGLDIPSGYFPEAMERLSTRYLNVPLDAVLHPVSTQVSRKVREEKVAADKALSEKKGEVGDLIKPVHENTDKQDVPPGKKTAGTSILDRQSKRKQFVKLLTGNASGWFKSVDIRKYGLGLGILLIATVGYFVVNTLIQNLGVRNVPSPTKTKETVVEITQTSQQGMLTVTNTEPPKVPAETDVSPVSTATAMSPSATSTPELGIGSTMTGKDGMTLLYIPAGEFTMGSEDGAVNEKPVHSVYLDPFWFDQTEVTNSMYADFLNDVISQDSVKLNEFVDIGDEIIYDLICNGCPNWIDRISWSGTSFSANSSYDNHPVVNVTWYGANEYCSWADRRLPTEAEWEKSARGPDGLTYPWGETLECGYANYYFCIGDTAAVGGYSDGQSYYGAYNMAGNVEEWVSSLEIAYPYREDDGREDLSEAGKRLRRGTSWRSSSFYARSSARLADEPDGRGMDIGFRCAMDAE